MIDYKTSKSKLSESGKPMREWLLLQAQLKLDYSNPENAITLLELVEQVYGPSLTSGLMLCKARSISGELSKLEQKASVLLAKKELLPEQRAAVYYCLSIGRTKKRDKSGAQKAHKLYLLHIFESAQS